MQVKIINHQDNNFIQDLEKIIQNNHKIDESQEKIVIDIINQVKKDGDLKIIELCNKFDNANFQNPLDLVVSQEEIESAEKNLDDQTIKDLHLAYERILVYHKKQSPQDFSYEDDLGNVLGNKWQPIEKVAIYVPGGTALYPSSVLMNAIPAIVAGCDEIIMTTPSDCGKINNAVLMAAKICGIKTIYKVGGAPAIAALSLGTGVIKKVDKIVGPGNSFVALAKKHLFGTVGIDMIAGPTDILIIADSDNNPNWIAADFLSQLEHGPDSRSIFITDDQVLAKEVAMAIEGLASTLSRFAIIKESLKNSTIIIVKNLREDSVDICNKVAPEHLEIMTKDPQEIADRIKNAGAIFLGKYSPEAIGDYIAGPSHTLPTLGSARFSSGLSVFDFLKRISVINFCEKGFRSLQKSSENLAEIEGFDAHKLSISIRRP